MGLLLRVVIGQFRLKIYDLLLGLSLEQLTINFYAKMI